MANELVKMVTGESSPTTREDKRAARQGNIAINEVRLRALQIDGALALAGHTMEGVIELDDHRKYLARDDVARNLLLADIEEACLQQVRAIQRSLFDVWGL